MMTRKEFAINQISLEEKDRAFYEKEYTRLGLALKRMMKNGGGETLSADNYRRRMREVLDTIEAIDDIIADLKKDLEECYS